MTTRKYSSRSQQTTLTSSVTSGATSIVVANASILFAGGIPSSGQTFTVVINPDTALEEIVDVTSASSNTLIVSRAQDMNGGTAQDHSAGAVVRHMIIGRDLRESNLHIEATTGYNDGTGAHTLHGLSSTDGNVVGTAANQTLTNKTFTTPTINGATLSGTITSTATVSGGTITGAVVTGLTSSSLTDTQATPKNYVDAFFGPLTSAVTSANSAAASATAAATSAASAVVSQTAAATSASSALTSQTSSATSATSAAASATAAATSATSAAASATAAATSATSAAASATAANSSAVTAAASVATIATYASNAATSATSAANSATAAATSAASAAASTSAAATSATSAAASATAAATSASSALVSQTAAATSATSAAASQTAAATSASSASVSQSAAATSAASAATSASSAATSASDAATTYDNFDDRYLGSKPTAPTVDNDGNTLLIGAIYWNSSFNTMYVWSGSVWVQIANTTTYTAPTIGSVTIASGGVYTDITGLTINSTTIPTNKTLVDIDSNQGLLNKTINNTTIPTSKTLVDTDSSQTLTNKTLSGAVAAADPTVNLGLATKQYVDAVTAANNYHAPVKAATSTNISTDYNNGTSGIGATLTAAANGAIGNVDGVAVALNDRILVKAQTDTKQNGVYYVSDVGSATSKWVVTRTLDQDNSVPGEMRNGDTFFCTSGTLNSGKTFINATLDDPIVLGTTLITYSEFTTALPTQSGNAGRYLQTDGTSPSWQAVTTLPSQSSNAGKYLTTDGSTASWAAVNASGPIILGLMGAY